MNIYANICICIYIFKEQLGCPNLNKLEWESIRSLAGDRSIVIKKVDKVSCIVVWDRLDYLMEAEK